MNLTDEKKRLKEALVEETLKSLRELFGDKSLSYRNGNGAKAPLISSGSEALDEELGGGFKSGSIVELFGKESSGKTTLCLKLISRIQASGGAAAIIDAEHTFDPKYALSLGIDTLRLLVSSPSTAEDALSICERLVRSRIFKVVVLDSVAALVSRLEIESVVIGEADVLQAKLVAQALRRITRALADSGTLVIFINQLRDRPRHLYFAGETTPGGAALKFSANYRIRLCDGGSDFLLVKGRKL